MDPRVIAERKAVAMARIESALGELSSKSGFEAGAAGVLRKSNGDPDVVDLMRLEGMADLVESLIVLVEDRAGKVKTAGVKPQVVVSKKVR